MARYRRYRRTIVRAPKKKWGSNLMNVQLQVTNNTTAITGGYNAAVLAQNKTETTAPTPVIVKTGNFKLQADLTYLGQDGATSTPTASLYIVFVPQGMEPQTYAAAAALVNNHPEWILAWRYLESSQLPGQRVVDTNRFTLSSRLKRNLNSGDSIYVLLLASDLNPTQACSVKGMCQFWTCAN